MGKVYHFLIALLCLGSFNTAFAQAVCESVTHTSGAVLLANGITVTVSGTSSNTSSYNCPAPPGPVGLPQTARTDRQLRHCDPLVEPVDAQLGRFVGTGV